MHRQPFTRPVVTIFGGGITGLTVAHELIERGFIVNVIEKRAEPYSANGCHLGGLAASQYVPSSPQRELPAKARKALDDNLALLRDLPPSRAQEWKKARQKSESKKDESHAPPLHFDLASVLARPGAQPNAPLPPPPDEQDFAVDLVSIDFTPPAPPNLTTKRRRDLERLVRNMLRLSRSRRMTHHADPELVVSIRASAWALEKIAASIESARDMLYLELVRIRDQCGGVGPWAAEAMEHFEGLVSVARDRSIPGLLGSELVRYAIEKLAQATHLTPLAEIEEIHHHLASARDRARNEADIRADLVGKADLSKGGETLGKTLDDAAFQQWMNETLKGLQDRANRPGLGLHRIVELRSVAVAPELSSACRGRASVSADCTAEVMQRDSRAPGEHGHRFFPGFYRNTFHTMRRIPVLDRSGADTARTVFDNLSPLERLALDDEDHRMLALPRQPPRTLGDLKRALRDITLSLHFTASDQARFNLRLLQYLTMSPDRKASELEKISWWDYIQGDAFTPLARKQLEAAPHALVAMSVHSDARMIGAIMVQFLVDYFTDGKRTDLVLGGPTSRAWFDPWREYLVRQGVRFYRGELKQFNESPDSVVPVVGDECARVVDPLTGAPVPFADVASGGRVDSRPGFSDLRLDPSGVDPANHFFVLATDVAEAKRVILPLNARAGSAIAKLKAYPLNHVEALPAEGDSMRIMTGIQYYFEERLNLFEGHIYFTSSPWALTSISQPQFWKGGPGGPNGAEKYLTVISVDIGRFDVAGFNGKRAWDCSCEEIAIEVWQQMIQSLDYGDALPEWDAYHIDDFVEFRRFDRFSFKILQDVERTGHCSPTEERESNEASILVEYVDELPSPSSAPVEPIQLVERLVVGTKVVEKKKAAQGAEDPGDEDEEDEVSLVLGRKEAATEFRVMTPLPGLFAGGSLERLACIHAFSGKRNTAPWRVRRDVDGPEIKVQVESDGHEHEFRLLAFCRPREGSAPQSTTLIEGKSSTVKVDVRGDLAILEVKDAESIEFRLAPGSGVVQPSKRAKVEEQDALAALFPRPAKSGSFDGSRCEDHASLFAELGVFEGSIVPVVLERLEPEDELDADQSAKAMLRCQAPGKHDVRWISGFSRPTVTEDGSITRVRMTTVAIKCDEDGHWELVKQVYQAFDIHRDKIANASATPQIALLRPVSQSVKPSAQLRIDPAQLTFMAGLAQLVVVEPGARAPGLHNSSVQSRWKAWECPQPIAGEKAAAYYISLLAFFPPSREEPGVEGRVIARICLRLVSSGRPGVWNLVPVKLQIARVAEGSVDIHNLDGTSPTALGPERVLQRVSEGAKGSSTPPSNAAATREKTHTPFGAAVARIMYGAGSGDSTEPHMFDPWEAANDDEVRRLLGELRDPQAPLPNLPDGVVQQQTGCGQPVRWFLPDSDGINDVEIVVAPNRGILEHRWDHFVYHPSDGFIGTDGFTVRVHREGREPAEVAGRIDVGETALPRAESGRVEIGADTLRSGTGVPVCLRGQGIAVQGPRENAIGPMRWVITQPPTRGHLRGRAPNYVYVPDRNVDGARLNRLARERRGAGASTRSGQATDHAVGDPGASREGEEHFAAVWMNRPSRVSPMYQVNPLGDFAKRPGMLPSPKIEPTDPHHKEPVDLEMHGHNFYKNLVLAGTYMKTHIRLTSMEGANESARHAVNVILEELRQRRHGTRFAEDCKVWNVEEDVFDRAASFIPVDIPLLQRIDKILFDRGLPHMFEYLRLYDMRWGDTVDIEAVLRVLERLPVDRGALSGLLGAKGAGLGDVAKIGEQIMQLVREWLGKPK